LLGVNGSRQSPNLLSIWGLDRYVTNRQAGNVLAN